MSRIRADGADADKDTNGSWAPGLRVSRRTPGGCISEMGYGFRERRTSVESVRRGSSILNVEVMRDSNRECFE